MTPKKKKEANLKERKKWILRLKMTLPEHNLMGMTFTLKRAFQIRILCAII
jgi:hypothetical protein